MNPCVVDVDSKYVRVWQMWNLLQVSDNRNHPPVKESETTDISTPHAEDNSLRHRLQMARVDKGISIQATAEAIRCSRESLAAYERGEDELSSDTVRQLQKFLTR